MKRFLLGLYLLVFMASACTPAPTPIPFSGTPVVPQVTITPTSIPAGKLPVIAIQTSTPASPSLPFLNITTLQAHGGHVSWLGSNNVLVFDEQGKDGYWDVYTARMDGSNKKCLTCGKKDLPQKNNGNPNWNPNGNYIVFQSQEPDFKLKGQALGELMTSPSQGYNNNVWVMAADGSNFWQITHIYPMGGVLNPHFSPDGKKIIWSEMITSGGIGQWVIRMADFSLYNSRPLIKNLQTLSPLSLQWYESHNFSPDQSHFLFTGLPQGKWFYDTEIYAYDLPSQTTVALTQNNEWDENANYSPDGKWIAWASSAGIPQVHAVSLQDMGLHPLKTDVWIMQTDGSNKQRLTRFNDPAALEGSHAPVGVSIGDIAWGPDNRSIAIRQLIGRNESIVLVKFDPQTLAH